MSADLYDLRQDFDRLRGRLFEVVEACGFPSRQEKAAKSVIRRTTYDSQRAIEGALPYVTGRHEQAAGRDNRQLPSSNGRAAATASQRGHSHSD